MQTPDGYFWHTLLLGPRSRLIQIHVNIRPHYVPWLAHRQWPMLLPMLMQATAYVTSHANVD